MHNDDPEQWGAWMAAAQSGHGGAYRRLLGELRTWLLRYFARRSSRRTCLALRARRPSLI